MIKTILLAFVLVFALLCTPFGHILYMPISYKDARNRAIDNGALYSQKYNYNGKCYANTYVFETRTMYPADILVIFMLGSIYGAHTFVKVFTKDHRLLASTGWEEPGIGTREISEWGSNVFYRYPGQMGHEEIELRQEDCGN